MSRRFSLVSCFIALPYVAMACADGVATGPGPHASGEIDENAGTASLVVTVLTSGVVRESDSHVVYVDRAPRGSIGPNGQLVVRSLRIGSHIVALSGLPRDCAHLAEEQHVVTLTKGSTGASSFPIFCGATSGIRVTTKTQFFGRSWGNGYSVVLDESRREHIDLNGLVVFTDVAMGVHQVTLTEIPDGCGFLAFTVISRAPTFFTRTVDAYGGRELKVDFSITCLG